MALSCWCQAIVRALFVDWIAQFAKARAGSLAEHVGWSAGRDEGDDGFDNRMTMGRPGRDTFLRASGYGNCQTMPECAVLAAGAPTAIQDRAALQLGFGTPGAEQHDTRFERGMTAIHGSMEEK